MYNIWMIFFYLLCLDFRVYLWIEIFFIMLLVLIKEYKISFNGLLKINNFKKRKYLKFEIILIFLLIKNFCVKWDLKLII